jgi:hypothetical protein
MIILVDYFTCWFYRYASIFPTSRIVDNYNVTQHERKKLLNCNDWLPHCLADIDMYLGTIYPV